jgi:glucose-6-phosphate isomerase
MDLLVALADEAKLSEKMSKMRAGAIINGTEKRSVLHHALRMPKNYDFDSVGADVAALGSTGKAIVEDVHHVLASIKEFANKIRTGAHLGVTGKKIMNYVCVGIGGSQLVSRNGSDQTNK